MTCERRGRLELWIRVIGRAANVLLFVMILAFYHPVHWLSRAFYWEGDLIVKERPVAAEARTYFSDQAPFVDIHIGRAYNTTFSGHFIQAWHLFISPAEISEFIFAARETRDDQEAHLFYVRLFIGPDVHMELVRSIQLELRKAGVDKVMYMAWVQ